jgi:1,4-alpha-glucan branching enzyme
MTMLKKHYPSRNGSCKVTFNLPAAIKAQSACVVGDFNGWDRNSIPMKRLKDGTWKADVTLQAGKEYHYR